MCRRAQIEASKIGKIYRLCYILRKELRVKHKMCTKCISENYMCTASASSHTHTHDANHAHEICPFSAIQGNLFTQLMDGRFGAELPDTKNIHFCTHLLYFFSYFAFTCPLAFILAASHFWCGNGKRVFIAVFQRTNVKIDGWCFVSMTAVRAYNSSSFLRTIK